MSDPFGVPKRYAMMRRASWEGDFPLSDPWTLDPWSIAIIGPTGTGKTHLAVAILWEWYVNVSTLWLNELPDEEDPVGRAQFRRANPEPAAAWFSVPDTLDQIKAEFDRGGDTKKRLRTRCPIILDDLGAERPTPFAVDTLLSVLLYRYDHVLPTIITSNAEDLSVLDNLSPRVSSRLAEGVVLIREGRDRRLP